MWSDQQIQLVQKRLKLLNHLNSLKLHFKGRDKKIYDKSTGEHIYQDFDGLRTYLALTCFDILGQSAKWLDFNSWLISRKTTEEREKIFKEITKDFTNENILKIHNEYQKIYGMKNSFYRFVTEIINEKNRNKLFESIRASIEITPEIISHNNKSVPTGKDYALTNEMKARFLFEIRNSFTHKGISSGNGLPGLYNLDAPLFYDEKYSYDNAFMFIYKKKSGTENIYYRVRQWPYCLIEIIEDTIFK